MKARALAVVVAAMLSPRRVHAQESPVRVQRELRADLLVGRRPAVQAGAGIQVPLGYYVRIGGDAAVGSRIDGEYAGRLDGRIDLLGRFLLDPFRQSAYGVSAGAGLSSRLTPGQRATPLLLVALDLELRKTPGWTPALQVGLGGGARVGLVLRRGMPGAR